MNSDGPNPVVTLSLAVAAGGFLMVAAKKMRIPGIVLLLIGGVAMGPEGANIVQPDSLGLILNGLVSVAVGIILFEGGLTLNLDGYRTAPFVIRNLLTVGVVVTWFGTASMIWLLFDVPLSYAVLAGSLVIVTGPTVIQPLLKRIRLRYRLHNILHWEGVLIDPIGVFLAILAFEWVLGAGGETALLDLLIRITGGLTIGFVGGEIISWLLRRRWIPDDLLNVFVLSGAIAVYGFTEMLIVEGGLLSVTVAGLICGARQPPALKSIVEFKSILTDLLIGFVFVLLTARLELSQFQEFGMTGFILVAIVIFGIRPLTILASTIGAEVDWKEKIFLSWVAPRGVVAASMASLFGLTLAQQGMPSEGRFIETFVYSVIFGTVLLQGFSAGPLAKILGLLEKQPDGWLLVGAHPVARQIARFLRDVRKVPVALIDGNRRAVTEAKQEGLNAFFADARETSSIEDRAEMRGVGKLIAFTDNEDLNELLCKKWESVFGAGNVFRWASTPVVSSDETATGTVLWSWMPKPSMISSELMLEAGIVELEGMRLTNPGNLAALITANSKEILLDPGPDSALKSDKVSPRTLYLQREADYLLNALHPEWILRLDPASKETLFKDLANRLSGIEPNVSPEAAFNQIMDREEAAPTTLGHGVAIPHAHVDGLQKSYCFMVRFTRPLTFYPEEAEGVQLIFLLLSPPDEPEIHLAILGEIARLCSDQSIREQIIAVEDPNEAFALVRRHRRQHTAFADARS